MKQRAVMLATWAVVVLGLVLALWMSAAPARHAPQTPPAPQPTPAAVPAPAPLTGLTVLVDPGHGGYDGGARCRDSGVWEKQVNLAVAQRLQAALEALGARVLMTRTTDEDLCTDERPASVSKKREDLQRRVDMAVQGGADMVVSVHMNEYRARSESGPQVFYRAGCESGRLLAGCVQDALIHAVQPRKKRACMAGDYFVLQLDVPSVLVECGFISNPEEERLLLDAAYQQRVAEAIAEGVAMYWGLQESGAA